MAVVQTLSTVRPFATPWIAAHQAPLSSIISRSLLRFMSIELVMLPNHCYILSPCSLCDPFFFFLFSVWLLFINHQNIWPICLISRCFGLIYIANFFFFFLLNVLILWVNIAWVKVHEGCQLTEKGTSWQSTINICSSFLYCFLAQSKITCLIFEEILREVKKTIWHLYLISITIIEKIDTARGKNRIPIWEIALSRYTHCTMGIKVR